jgi:hypothetical protein
MEGDLGVGDANLKSGAVPVYRMERSSAQWPPVLSAADMHQIVAGPGCTRLDRHQGPEDCLAAKYDKARNIQ